MFGSARTAREGAARPRVGVGVGSHDVHGDGGGQALADVLEEVVGGEQVGAAGNQVLLELQQLRASTQEDLRRTQKTQASRRAGKEALAPRRCPTLSPKRR